MSTMTDKNQKPKYDNVRGLVQDLSELLDSRMQQFRHGTEHDWIRPSDAKMFMLIARHSRTLSQLASALKISRQAAHSSIKRLIEKGMIELDYVPGNKRDKTPTITAKGQAARGIAASHIGRLEREMIDVLGEQKTETLRGLLKELSDGLKQPI
ncbi:MAG: hypothetical protein OFPI_29070 [Osedax symbiont Rs2]|nr:MAG: hypothetical protein OFPI_29070 [Osedax symbiont Rs2]